MFRVTRKIVVKGINYKAGDNIKVEEKGLIQRLLNIGLIEKSKKEVVKAPLDIKKESK